MSVPFSNDEMAALMGMGQRYLQDLLNPQPPPPPQPAYIEVEETGILPQLVRIERREIKCPVCWREFEQTEEVDTEEVDTEEWDSEEWDSEEEDTDEEVDNCIPAITSCDHDVCVACIKTLISRLFVGLLGFPDLKCPSCQGVMDWYAFDIYSHTNYRKINILPNYN